MPFQVTYSQRLVQVNAIQSVDAGFDGSAVCDTSYSLEATVVGEIAGHTVLWEQIGGDPVTFTTPLDQFAISYNQTTFDDKVFRFYVDKGQARERFDDVTIFGSPVTIVSDKVMSTSSAVVNSTITTVGEQLTIKLVTPYPQIMHGGEYALDVYTSAVLVWDAPATDNTIVQYTVKERDNTTGLWTDVAILPATALLFTGVDVTKSYKISVTYRYNNSHVGQVESNMVWASGNLTDARLVAVDAYNVSMTATGNHLITYGYDIEKLFIITIDPPTTAILMPPMDTGRVNFTYEVETLSLTQKQITPDSHYGSAPTANTLIAYDYDVTVLIGVPIGGNVSIGG